MIDKHLESFILHYINYQKPIYKKTKIIGELITDINSVYPFIINYAETFRVDISEFDLQKYLSKNGEINLTVEDLEKGIVLGTLNENVISLKNDEQQLPSQLSLKNILKGLLLLALITAVLFFVAFYI